MKTCCQEAQPFFEMESNSQETKLLPAVASRVITQTHMFEPEYQQSKRNRQKKSEKPNKSIHVLSETLQAKDHAMHFQRQQYCKQSGGTKMLHLHYFL